MANRTYKPRSRHLFNVRSDFEWLQNAQNVMRDAFANAFPQGAWPMRARRMDKVLRAMHDITAALHDGVAEAATAAGVDILKEGAQHGFPSKRGE